MFLSWLLFVIFTRTIISFKFTSGAHENCTDFEGGMWTHGELYIPGPNVCSLCVCYHGGPMWCQLIFCLGPPKCRNITVGKYCCDFECLDPGGPIKKRRRSAASKTLCSIKNLYFLFCVSLILIL